MRVRLRETPPAYDRPYDHTRWDEHVRRVQWTINAAVALQRGRPVDDQWYDALDLSCGDGAVPLGLQRRGAVDVVTLGDVVDGTTVGLDVIGAIEDTLDLHRRPAHPSDQRYDLFICTETLEHLADPDLVLNKIRGVAKTLLLTTPVGETLERDNDEHLWSWEPLDVVVMLQDAGFDEVLWSDTLACNFYTYQLWVVR